MHSMSRSLHLVELGARVAGLRRGLGWSQERLAAEAGLHRTYVGRVERGEQNLSLMSLFKLAEALRVSPAELLPPVSPPGQDERG